MRGTFLTDRGRVRSHNEDAGGIYYNSTNQLLAVIADGMGGHQAGDVASKMAITQIDKQWKNTKKFEKPNEIEEWLQNTIQEINKAIYEHAQNNQECEGMGTTLVIVVHIDEFLTVAHIGDSRCYLLNQHKLKQVTEDHSLVNALVQSGQISRDDAKHHPRKNVVLRALGSELQVDADIKTISIDENEKILLATDGLTDKILDEELFEIINKHDDIHLACQELIDLANNRGGEDNISLILLSNHTSLKEGENE
ncbi:Stp1/IreP family PP2C-type Ser/Thr phosphatase [Oceanobacillus caeni]|uniref:Protein phosphatase n=1 Tax=Oceanobacillus caeni TaxID=405946 RepID=A0ABR5MLW9_9BACI|nr:MULTISPECIES: Stp1/IreP family PP2C-type Ser/Thr phosphatase [Bacillaceae]KKE78326.1 protein phosphatase [Bacilli bacterium VT-13-104]PZD84158.1 Stp1/IreP family PP2C-type Ser/Thr phosphatase [Bacilli bacterium]KPH77149.1 protein phosphatase [Oceanobacillus caeni]MBU8790141.1 Stp1/IreP family PP2C-type Ser/Thr phosphatase [Oceanobacillus caeni]MCR1833300.1 Stp1/IreP family PP2C-type Ser/Thr phosphatase [Oceanobacillus caeni]